MKFAYSPGSSGVLAPPFSSKSRQSFALRLSLVDKIYSLQSRRHIILCHSNLPYVYLRLCLPIYRQVLRSRSRGLVGSMPTTLVRSVKASQIQHLNSLQSYKAVLHHIINLRHFWWQPQVGQLCTEPARQEGFNLFRPSLSSPPTGNKARPYLFTLDSRGILSSKDRFLLKMEEEKRTVSVDEKLKTSGEDAKLEEKEKVRLQKEQEKRKEEEEQRNRVKEQEMEDKIGPPPEKPLAGDCCGQGCEVCVWDTYWDELNEYKKLRKATEEESG